MFQTEFEFSLPCGYLDEEGNLHRDGVMRRDKALHRRREPWHRGHAHVNRLAHHAHSFRD